MSNPWENLEKVEQMRGFAIAIMSYISNTYKGRFPKKDYDYVKEHHLNGINQDWLRDITNKSSFKHFFLLFENIPEDHCRYRLGIFCKLLMNGKQLTLPKEILISIFDDVTCLVHIPEASNQLRDFATMLLKEDKYDDIGILTDMMEEEGLNQRHHFRVGHLIHTYMCPMLNGLKR